MTTFIAPQLGSIPAQLRGLNQWVTWRAINRPGEKPTKVPFIADDSGRKASTTDPTTWRTFAEASAAYTAGGQTGIGIVLNGNGLVGVDIDHCVENGVPDPKAIALIESLGAGYIELSPSGTGLRAFGYADGLEQGRKGKLDGLDVELYSSGRYLTLTGRTLKAGPIVALTGFGELAEKIRTDRRVDPETGEILEIPADQKHAELIRRVLSGDVYHDSLRDLAASYVANGMRPGAAVTQLRAMMDNCGGAHDARWAARRSQIPDLVKSAEAKFAVKQTGPITVVAASEFVKRPRPEWIVKGLIPQAEFGILYGESGAGKTFGALDLVWHIAKGLEWHRRRVKPCRVVYVAAEGAGGFLMRLEALSKHRGESLEGMEIGVMDAAPDLLNGGELNLIKAIRESGGAGVVFIDTLAQTTPGANENTSEDMGRAIAAVKYIAAELSAMVMVVHHAGKDLDRGARGWSGMKAAADVQIQFSRPGGGDLRVMRLDKSKDGLDGIEYQFNLLKVPLGHDSDGDPVDSCVCEWVAKSAPVWKPAGEWQKRAVDATNQILDDMGFDDKLGDDDTVSISVVDLIARMIENKAHDPQSRDRRRELARRGINEVVACGPYSLCNDGTSLKAPNPTHAT